MADIPLRRQSTQAGMEGGGGSQEQASLGVMMKSGSFLNRSPLLGASPTNALSAHTSSAACLNVLRSHFGDPIAPLSALANTTASRALKEEAEALIYLWQMGAAATTPAGQLRNSGSFAGSFAAGPRD